MVQLVDFQRRVAVGALCLALVGCAALGRPPVLTPQPPSVTAVSSSGLELDVALRVDNPNDFPLVAHTMNGTLRLAGDQQLGTGSALLEQPIPARSAGTVRSKLHIGWSSAPALSALLTQASVPYTFEGHLGVSGGHLKLKMAFELDGSLTREQVAAIAGGALSPLPPSPREP